mmetsp:Transcript_32987/g.46035  ORF Transcript_32987/g.46035 Transcript_32987/m.46035 type:complete len:98 (+) Transcript_32987:268-561(+)
MLIVISSASTSMSATWKVSLSMSLVLWIVLLIGQISFSLLACIVFFGSTNTYDAAVKAREGTNFNETFSTFYETSGFKTSVNFVCETFQSGHSSTQD